MNYSNIIYINVYLPGTVLLRMNDGELDPTGVFDVASNSTRVEILRVLVSAYSDTPNDPWLEYTELRKAVGIRDNGNFNYHLDRLDALVVKGSSGYRISRIGMEIVSAVSSGVFDGEWTWGPVDAPGGCLFCDDSLQIHYEDGILWLTCGRDEHSLALSVPPSLLDSHPEGDVIERIALVENRWSELIRNGICAECLGYVDGNIEYGGVQPAHYHYHGHCHRCGFQHGIPVGMFLISHPAVVDFYHECDINIRTTPFWTLEFCTPGNETVVSTDPLRLRVGITEESDELSLTLDREGTIVSTDRS